MSHNLVTQASRQSLITFLDRAMPQQISEYQHFPYVDLLGAYFEDLILHKEAGRLAVNLPPRHGKSFIVVALAAWFLGQNSAKEVLLIVHSHTLAVDLAGKLQQLLQSTLFKETFPEFGLQLGRESMTDFRTTAGGGFKAGSIDSNITGRGADLLLIDDILPAQDTTSANARASVRDTYDSTIATRLNNPETATILSISHRLHPEDLTAHLLHLGFNHLKLPFMATENESYSLCGINFKREENEILQPGRLSIETTKRNVSAHVFETQYQQAPTAIGSGILNEGHFPLAVACPQGGRTVISWDTASSVGGNSSYSVGLVFQIVGNAAYLRHIERGRFEFGQLSSRARHLHDTFKPTIHLVEDTSIGPALIAILKEHGANTLGMKVGLTSKIDRLYAVMNLIDDKFIRPVAGIPNLREFIDESLAFPNGTNDDLVDALTQFLDWHRKNPVLPPNTHVVVGAGKIKGLRGEYFSRTDRAERLSRKRKY